MEEILQLILGPAGVTVLVLVLMFTGWKGLWVFGWQYKDMKQDRDEWKEAALRGTRVAERAIEVHEKVVNN